MKILYVVSRPLMINTSASIRNRATIMGLVENGHDVELVTTEPDSNHTAFDGSMILENVKVTYIKLNGIQDVAKIGRKFRSLEPLKHLVVKCMNFHSIYDNLKGIVDHISEININEYDLIISSSDPKSSHLFVEKAREQQGFKGKWIQIWGDPFLNDITLTNGVKRRKIFREEKRLLSSCDKVVYVSELTLESQKRLFPMYAGKMTYIPIPYLNEIVNPVRNLSDVHEINIVYCGDYAKNVRNIIPLYDAVKEIGDTIKLVICGNSDFYLKEESNISVLGRQPYKVVEKLERDSDILVHISNLRGNQIPGKIYQYSGTNKPILFILDGEKESLKQQFSKYNRYCFSNNDKELIKQALRYVIEENKSYSPVLDFSKKEIARRIIQ